MTGRGFRYGVAMCVVWALAAARPDSLITLPSLILLFLFFVSFCFPFLSCFTWLISTRFRRRPMRKGKKVPKIQREAQIVFYECVSSFYSILPLSPFSVSSFSHFFTLIPLLITITAIPSVFWPGLLLLLRAAVVFVFSDTILFNSVIN